MPKWVTGQSGNPKGRPRRGRSLSDLLRLQGNASTEEGQTLKKAFCAALWQFAIAGNMHAARLILEYIEGKPAIVQPDAAPLPAKTYTVAASPDDWPEQPGTKNLEPGTGD